MDLRPIVYRFRAIRSLSLAVLSPALELVARPTHEALVTYSTGANAALESATKRVLEKPIIS